MKTLKTITSYAGQSITSRKVAREVVATLKGSSQVAKVVDNGAESSQRWTVSIECDIKDTQPTFKPRQTLTVSRKPSGDVFASCKKTTASNCRTSANKHAQRVDSPFAMLQDMKNKSVQVYTKKTRKVLA